MASPDKMALAGDGAEECASGSQTCNGKSADLTANPTKTRLMAIQTTCRFVCQISFSACEANPIFRCPVIVYMKPIPHNTRAEPKVASMRYVNAASAARGCLRELTKPQQLSVATSTRT